MPSTREERAAARQNWPGTIGTVHRPAQLPTAAERLASMWQLALDAWSHTGQPLPDYTRANIPGKLIRPGDK